MFICTYKMKQTKLQFCKNFQCELMRDVGIVDVYRHMEGAPLRGAFPVVVQFKVIKLTGKIIRLIWRILTVELIL